MVNESGDATMEENIQIILILGGLNNALGNALYTPKP